MIRARREEQQRDPEVVADDVRAWLRGDESVESFAGAQFVGELLLRLHRSPPVT